MFLSGGAANAGARLPSRRRKAAPAQEASLFELLAADLRQPAPLHVRPLFFKFDGEVLEATEYQGAAGRRKAGSEFCLPSHS